MRSHGRSRNGTVPSVTDTTWLDATAQADLVRRGEASPAELVDAAIARIEALNPRLDAVLRTRFDQARAQAAGTLPDGPFRGVPILLKDIGCFVAGEVTAGGLGPLKGQVWRVGLMGESSTEGNVLLALSALERVLPRCGYAVKAGAAVEAAARQLAA